MLIHPRASTWNSALRVIRILLDTILTCVTLRWSETSITESKGGFEAWRLVETRLPDMVILDLDLPDTDGFDVLHQIRSISDVPLVALSTNQRVNIVRSLEAGADDCIVKPFYDLEFLARLKTLLRRAGVYESKSGREFQHGKLSIDFYSREVRLDGKLIKLTPTEYNLLQYLVKNAGRIVPHHVLLEEVWGKEYINATEYLKVYVNRLRAKLGNGNTPFIVTERKIGYKVEKPSDYECA